MPVLQKTAFTHIKEWTFVTMGILVYVLGWSLFLIPNNLVGGGVSGISSMIQYATQGKIQMGYSYLVINAVLIAAAVIVLGMGFGAKTIYAIILASVALRFLPDMIPPSIVNTLALQNGKLMSVIMGGLMAGIGIGMSISNGGSTGGTDIIALIYTKYHNVSPGRVIMLIDVVIIGCSFFVSRRVSDFVLLGMMTLSKGLRMWYSFCAYLKIVFSSTRMLETYPAESPSSSFACMNP